jgi:hypothetical protein
VECATQNLDEIIGKTAPLVSAEWSLMQDGSGRLLLELHDFTGASVEAKFDRAEFDRPVQLETKLYRIWGDLLQDRSHKQLEVLSGANPGGQ